MAFAGRKKTPYEKPGGGFPRPGGERTTRIFRGEVTGVFPDERTVECSWSGRRGSPERIPLFSDVGDYSLPKPGDIVLIVVDSADQPYVIAFRDLSYPDRVKTGQLPPVTHGERMWFSKEFRQRLYFREDGSLQLFSPGDEGFEVLPTRRVRVRAPQLFETLSNAGKLLYGVVRRPTGLSPTTDEDEVITNPPKVPGATPHKEFYVDVNYEVMPPPLASGGKAGRFVFGTGVIDDSGVPRFSTLGAPLRAALEIMNLGGIPLASFQIDAAGNVMLNANAIAQFKSMLQIVVAPVTWVRSQSILLGTAPNDVALLSMRFLAFYNLHQHLVPQLPAGTTLSTPPLPRIPEPMVTSRTVFVQ